MSQLREHAGRDHWAIILAGGEGVRLRHLTRRLTGDDRPKQFCPILGPQTLLEGARKRAALALPRGRTLVVVTRSHESFYAPLLADVTSRCMVVQLENRGTAPAILYALHCVAARGPMDAVAILPPDHYVSDDIAFMAQVDAAFEATRPRSDLVIVLGITPEYPEVDCGWIEPGDPIPTRAPRPVYRVRRFWEKPGLEIARALFDGRHFWNSFVMVARVPTLLALVRRARPDLDDAFADAAPTLGTPREGDAIRLVYSQIPSLSFSQEILAPRPADLAVATRRHDRVDRPGGATPAARSSGADRASAGMVRTRRGTRPVEPVQSGERSVRARARGKPDERRRGSRGSASEPLRRACIDPACWRRLE